MIRKVLIIALILAFFPVVYIGFAKAPIDPAAYSPPARPPLTGVLAPTIC